MKIAVVAAHPDDEILGVGGTILRHLAAGDSVKILVAGRCRQKNYDKPRKIAKRIGARFVGNDHRSIHDFVEREIGKPDIIYTHHTGDLNAMHREVAEAALVAGRFVKSVRTFETVSSTEWGLTPFTPNLYVSINIHSKFGLLSEYADEMREPPHPRSLDNIDSLARLRGATAGVMFAEAFHVVRECW